MSGYYGIDGLGEAREYLAHPVLGRRLREITGILLEQPSDDAHAIFGTPDDLKLLSCMTLFDTVEPHSTFSQVIDRFYGGRRDEKTLSMLKTTS